MANDHQNGPRTGLALSGGGSRAAAFHCGTLQALGEILPRNAEQTVADSVDIVSTVSGGSVFAGAWMAARADEISDHEFLRTMQRELARGFIGRSIRPRLLKTVLPNYNRTNVIAETFNRIFFQGKTLGDLPEANPTLVLNTTVLNNGQVGKFTKDGFSLYALRHPSSDPPHLEPMVDFPLALAVAASAAFPVGLPPVLLKRSLFDPATTYLGERRWGKGISLTDGGVVENLGIQTLLKSHRFGVHHLIVSDAGTKEDLWQRRPIRNLARSTAIGLVAGATLDRIMIIMNSKQNRWARQQAIEEVHNSWLSEAVRSDSASPAVRRLIDDHFPARRRSALYVRINTNWNQYVMGIPYHQFIELGATEADVNALTDNDTVEVREQLLAGNGVNLGRARDRYARLGGDEGATAANAVTTNFTGIRPNTLDTLAGHAAWQVHLGHAVYGFG